MLERASLCGVQTIDQVQQALQQRGLESSDVIIAVDFTKSNEWTGKSSFGGAYCQHSPCISYVLYAYCYIQTVTP